MVLHILSTAFIMIQPHFILETISLGQCFGIHNEMREIFLECFMRNIIRKVASLFSPSPYYGPGKSQSRECETEKHLTNLKICEACLFQPCGKGKEERLRNEAQ